MRIQRIYIFIAMMIPTIVLAAAGWMTNAPTYLVLIILSVGLVVSILITAFGFKIEGK